MFNRSVQKSKPEKINSRSAQPTAGRERLHFFNAELKKANEAVADLEKRAATLENIGIDAIAADRALQLFIAQDGGTDALLAHSAGSSKPDDEIAKLIAAAKTTAEAAAPAKSALPLAQDALERARGEVIRLGDEKNAEIGRFLTLLADDTARKYKHAFADCCRLHDELLAFASGTSNPEVTMISEEIRLPRFNLPSLQCLNEYDPFMRHRANEYAVNTSSQAWLAIKSRIEADVDADVSDLLTG
jgi:hypothetical protein